MKNYYSILISLCSFIGILTSCQDSLVPLEPMRVGISRTRFLSGKELSDSYYWCNGKRYALKRYQNRYFVLFDGKEQSRVMQELISRGITPESAEIKRYVYPGTDNSGEFAGLMKNFYCMPVDAHKEEIESIKEIACYSPYMENEGGETFPLSNLLYLQFKKNESKTVIRGLMDKYGIGLVGKSQDIPGLYVLACDRSSCGDALEIANRIHEDENMKDMEIQPAFLSFKLDSADPLYTEQWNLVNSGQYGSSYAGIDINYQENEIPSTSNIIVGVIDSGIQLDHPDLNVCSYSWDSYNGTSPSLERTSHGTNVAGVISALNNSVGSVGIAPCVSVMSMSNVLGAPSSSLTSATIAMNLAASIKKAVDNGASVINCSWSGATADWNIEFAIDYAITNGRNGKGSVLVCSTGNGDFQFLAYPASHTPESDIISVGAFHYDGHRLCNASSGLSGSNYGTGLDVVAPGIKIATTDSNSSWITTFSGTSAAAPHVSAAAALILTINPDLSYRDVGYIIESTANKSVGGYSYLNYGLGGTWNEEVGYGLLDLHAALNMARSTTGSITSFTLSGPDMVNTDANGYASCSFSTSFGYTNYTYTWSVTGTSGAIDRWYLYPSGSGFGSSATLNVYKPLSSAIPGMVMITCRIYNGNVYMGAASKYVIIN